MLPSFADETVTQLRPAMMDDGRNNLVPDWNNVTETVIGGCSVQPGVSVEVLDHRDTSSVRWTVYAPPTAGFLSTDRAIYDGVTYEVDATPQRWRSPTGGLNHQAFLLLDWNG